MLLVALLLLVGCTGEPFQLSASDTPPAVEGCEPATSLQVERVVSAERRDGWFLELSVGQSRAAGDYHRVPEARTAVVWLSGADGGMDGPQAGFYLRLAEHLERMQVASFRLQYAAPMVLDTSVCETLLALRFLEQEGIEHVAVVGFSFGGAVAIEAAARAPQVRTVVTLASQSLGTDRVPELAPRPLLAIHPIDDQVVPAWVSEDIFDRAGDPKRLVLLPTADHYLSDVACAVQDMVLDWLRAHLPFAPSPPGPSAAERLLGSLDDDSVLSPLARTALVPRPGAPLGLMPADPSDLARYLDGCSD